MEKSKTTVWFLAFVDCLKHKANPTGFILKKVGTSVISCKMISKINLNNRNAFELLGILRDFNGAVYIEKTSEQRRANAKSLLGLLSLSVADGDEINIIIEDTHGEHEKVLEKLKSVLENK